MEMLRTSAWKVLVSDIHELIEDDMIFVCGRWEGEFEQVLSTCDKEDRYMGIGEDLARYELSVREV